MRPVKPADEEQMERPADSSSIVNCDENIVTCKNRTKSRSRISQLIRTEVNQGHLKVMNPCRFGTPIFNLEFCYSLLRVTAMASNARNYIKPYNIEGRSSLV